MPIDASIYSQFAPRVQTPGEVQNALMQTGIMQGQMQQNALAVQQARQAQADDQSLRSAAQGFGNDPQANYQAILKTGNVKAAQAYLQGALANQKTAAETDLAGAHAGEFRASATGKVLAAAREMLPMVQNPQQMGQWVDGLYANPATKDLVASQFGDPAAVKARIPTDPAEFQTFLKKNAMGMDKFIQDETSKANNAATNATHVQTTGMTNATSIKTTAMREAGENARHGETISNQRLLAGMNPDGSMRMTAGPDGTIDLKTVAPEDLAAAYRYKTDGTFPPNMGRGVQGAAEGRKIRAIASALDAQAGDSPEDARVRQLAAKGDVAAINKMRQREVAVGANVKNFDFNADQVQQLSGKVDRSGVPIANAWLNAGRRAVTGNPDLAAFDTAIKTTVNEFAQIVSGTTSGATAEGEKKKAEALLNAQQTPEQIMAVINQMRIESQNRMKSFKAQRAESMPTNAPRAAEAAPAAAPSGFKYIGPAPAGK